MIDDDLLEQVLEGVDGTKCVGAREEIVGEDYVSNLRQRMNEEVSDHIQIASDWMKQHYNITAREGGYKESDLVWLHNHQRNKGFLPKLQQNCDGRYRVMKRSSDIAHRIRKEPNENP